MHRVIFPILVAFSLLSCSSSERDKTLYTSYQSAQTYTPVVTNLPAFPLGQTPKNIILMIGDGMGLTHISCAWVVNHGALNMMACPYTGLSRTYCANRLITDSGAGGTALAIGEKTNKGHIGTCADGSNGHSLMEYAQNNGMRTGVSVVCRLCDATPADFCCHVNDRNQYDSILAGYLDCGVDYIAGGGRYFLTHREDGRNIISEMREQGYACYDNIDNLQAAAQLPIFAILADSEYVVSPDRGNLFQRQTMKAIELCGDRPFFLMVEGSCIDDYCHAQDLPHAMEELLDFDRTVGEVLRWAEQDGETLVVITADHETGALTLLDGDISEGRIDCHFANEGHSNIHVPVFAYGPGAERFIGAMENSEVGLRLRTFINQK